MIKELIFNGQKYWQSDEKPTPDWVNKTLKLSRNISNLNQYQRDADDMEGWHFWIQSSNYSLSQEKSYRVLKQAIDYNNETFIEIIVSSEFTAWFKMSDILQNGGVLGSHLNRLYQALHLLFARKVVQA